MSNIVPFTKVEDRHAEPKRQLDGTSAGEVVIFPGVRYEYETPDAIKLGSKL